MTFNTSNWGTAQTVKVTGVADDDALDEMVTVTVTATSTDTEYNGKSGSVTVTVHDDELPELVVEPDLLSIDEDGTGSFVVSLATRPSASVTVAVSSGDPDAVSVPPTALTFATTDWDTAQTVTVSGMTDDDTADESVTITVRASGGDYGSVTGEVTVTVIDDDTPDLLVDPDRVSLDEDGSDTFEVKLATRPLTQVTVVATSSDPGVAVPTASVTFTPSTWNTPQTVTVTGVADHDAVDESVTITLSTSGADYEGVTATVVASIDDDDEAAVVASPQEVSIDEGGSATIAVSLATQPSGLVRVTASPDDPFAVDTQSFLLLDFTASNWNIPQTVTLNGVQDSDHSDESVTVEVYVIGWAVEYIGISVDVTATVTDDDTANLLVDPGSLSIDEDGTGLLEVELATRPSATVTVTVESDDIGAATVSPASLTFTTINWGTAQTIIVSGVDDDDADDESPAVTLAASGGDYANRSASVPVAVTDDDTPDLVAAPDSLSISEGGSGTLNVSLATQPGETVLVGVFSQDLGVVSVPPTVLQFNDTNWQTAQSVTVSAVHDDDADDESTSIRLRVLSGASTYTGVEVYVPVTVTDDDKFPPASPDNLRVVREERTQVYVAWDEPSNNGPPLSGYTVRWRVPNGTWTEAAPVTTLGALLTALSAASQYEIQVQATNSFDKSPWSTSVTAYADDCAAASSNACSVTVGGSASGRVNVHDMMPDRDWYAVSLQQNKMYRIDVKGSEVSDSGGTLDDPEFAIYGPGGSAVSGAVANDTGAGLNAQLLFTPNSSGSYFIGVGEHGGDDTGTYTVYAAEELPPRFVGPTLLTFPENSTPSHQVSATDDDADDSITDFQITGGADRDKFTINADGTLSMTFAPNFDDPQDANDDNDYEVEIKVSSGPSGGAADASASATFIVRITNLADELAGVPSVRVVEEALNSITLRWYQNPSDTLPLTFSEIEVYDYNQARTILVTGRSLQAEVELLETNTAYQFRVRSINSDGVGSWSSSVNARTDDCSSTTDDACELTVGQDLVGRINVSSAGDSDWFLFTTSAAAYRIEIFGATPGASGGTLPDPTLRIHYGDGQTTPVVGNRGVGQNEGHILVPGSFSTTTFYLEVISARASQVGTYTVSVDRDRGSLMTGSGEPFNIYENSSLTTQLTITDPDPDDTYTDVHITDTDDGALFTLDADLNVSMNIIPDFERPQDVDNDNVYRFVVGYLNPTSYGGPAWSVFRTFRVTVLDDHTEAPGAPSDLRIVHAGLDSVEVEWVEAPNAGPDITSHQIRTARFVSFNAQVDWSTSTLTSSATSTTLASLRKDTRYAAQVRAINDEGIGPWSSTLSFQTDDCAGSVGTDACTLTVDSPKTGTIGTDGSGADRDLYAVPLRADHVYRIDVKGDIATDYGGSLSDPMLRILNWRGDSIPGAVDNDGGSGTNAKYFFEPALSDTYHIEVAANAASETGSYTVSVALVDRLPLFTGSTQLTLAENAALRHQLTAVDNDPGHSISGFAVNGGDDMDKFSIDSNGILSMTITPNFEDKQDADSDNVYEVEITVSSGPGGTADRQNTADFTVTITDVDGEVPSAPDASVVKEGRTDIDVQWDAPSNSGPPIVGYMARIATLDSVNSGTPPTWQASDLGPSARDESWTALSPDTDYVVQVRASNAEGIGPWTELGVHTDDCSASVLNACTAMVDGFAVGIIDVDLQGADKDWYAVSLLSNHQYQIDVKTDGDPPPLNDAVLRVFGPGGSAITGAYDNDSGNGRDARYFFEPDTAGTYYVEAAGRVDGDTGRYQISVAVSDAPPRWVGVEWLRVSENTTISHQLMAVDNEGHSVGFSISGGPDMDKFSIDSNNMLSLTFDPDFENPQDRNSDNRYRFDITVSGDPGGGAPILDTVVDFLFIVADVDEPPAAPASLSATTDAPTQIEVGWSEPTNNGPDITSYDVRIAEFASSVWETDTVDASSARTHTLEDLFSDSLYKIQVRAVNDEGEGPWSSELYVRSDDCAAQTSTECAVSVDSAVAARINVGSSDKDWFEVQLQASVRYRVSVETVTLPNPQLKIFDSAGVAVAGAEDNDSGVGLNALYFFEPSSADTYYIEVSDHAGGEGAYIVSVQVVSGS